VTKEPFQSQKSQKMNKNAFLLKPGLAPDPRIRNLKEGKRVGSRVCLPWPLDMEH